MSDKHKVWCEANDYHGSRPCNCGAQSELASVTLLGITDTDRMDWLERQHSGIVTSSLRLMVDEMIKRERATVMPNAPDHRPGAEQTETL